MFKFIFKWLFRLVLAVVCLVLVAVVVLLLTYNTILKNIMERNIREQTGMDAEIGHLHVSLTEPAIEIQNLQIYNTKEFAGAPFMNIPEIHIEYDWQALMDRKIHVTLMRLKFGELDIVKNQSGQLNVLAMAGETTPAAQASATPSSQRPVASSHTPQTGAAPQPSHPGGAPAPAQKPQIMVPTVNFKEQTGYEFTGIDMLNVSFETEKYIDLQNPLNDYEQTVGLENCPVPHVKTTTDLLGLVALIDLKSGQFFQHVAGGNSPDPLKNFLRSLGTGN
ncbi:MAG TPA: hypothetical protein VGN23_06740 [Verrucomicrobiae bacterium]|jgi:hypothetical protein